MNIIENELVRHCINDAKYKLISEKDGVIVARVSIRQKNYILKILENDMYTREIMHYRLLNDIGIRTIETISLTDKSILMQDIVYHEKYRLAKEEDLHKVDVIKHVARWYKTLHAKGRQYLLENPDVELYSEIGLLDAKSIGVVRSKSGYDNADYWEKLNFLMPEIKEYVQRNRTITYNDFYYTNLVVSSDCKDAFMFDYNLLGQGLRYFDVRNVLYALDDEMKSVFITEYGQFNEVERIIYEATAPVIALVIAYRRPVFPKWGEGQLEYLESGISYEFLNKLIKHMH